MNGLIVPLLGMLAIQVRLVEILPLAFPGTIHVFNCTRKASWMPMHPLENHHSELGLFLAWCRHRNLLCKLHFQA
jgi:hypothetical protein